MGMIPFYDIPIYLCEYCNKYFAVQTRGIEKRYVIFDVDKQTDDKIFFKAKGMILYIRV
jgi:hypothetical protein